MSSRMRVTRRHTGNRRSHHGITAPRISECSNCGAYHQRHRVCKECGFYKGREVISAKTKASKATVVTAEDTPKETTAAKKAPVKKTTKPAAKKTAEKKAPAKKTTAAAKRKPAKTKQAK